MNVNARNACLSVRRRQVASPGSPCYAQCYSTDLMQARNYTARKLRIMIEAFAEPFTRVGRIEITYQALLKTHTVP